MHTYFNNTFQIQLFALEFMFRTIFVFAVESHSRKAMMVILLDLKITF